MQTVLQIDRIVVGDQTIVIVALLLEVQVDLGRESSQLADLDAGERRTVDLELRSVDVNDEALVGLLRLLAGCTSGGASRRTSGS